jgi:hypothetical protein
MRANVEPYLTIALSTMIVALAWLVHASSALSITIDESVVIAESRVNLLLIFWYIQVLVVRLRCTIV